MALLNSIIDEVETAKMEEQSDQYERNRSCCPEFLEFMQLFVCKMPLWCGVLLRLDRYKNTATSHEPKDESNQTFLSFKSENAKSEGYMRQLKQEDFPGKKRMQADAFP